MLAFAMRARRSARVRGKPARFRWGAWFALVALALNALVPIHIAFDLADALTPHAGPMAARPHSPEWRALAVLTGHFEDAAKSHHHGKHRVDCAICSSLGTLAGFASTATVVLPLPVAFPAMLPAAARAEELARTPAAAYLSRAPPLA